MITTDAVPGVMTETDIMRMITVAGAEDVGEEEDGEGSEAEVATGQIFFPAVAEASLTLQREETYSRKMKTGVEVVVEEGPMHCTRGSWPNTIDLEKKRKEETEMTTMDGDQGQDQETERSTDPLLLHPVGAVALIQTAPTRKRRKRRKRNTRRRRRDLQRRRRKDPALVAIVRRRMICLTGE